MCKSMTIYESHGHIGHTILKMTGQELQNSIQNEDRHNHIGEKDRTFAGNAS